MKIARTARWRLAGSAGLGCALALWGGCGENLPDPCAEDESLCEGAPEILQVFVKERLPDAAVPVWRLAYGQHPAAAPDDDGSVLDATTKQAHIELILDQPLAREGLVASGGLVAGAVGVVCEGAEMNVDPSASSYRAEVNQAAASTSELPDALGPAVVIAIEDALRTDSECKLELAGVVDDEGLGISNASAPFFHTEPLLLLDATPVPEAIDVPVDAEIRLRFNAPVDERYTSYVSLMDGSSNVASGTARVEEDPFAVEVLPPAGGLAHATTYRVLVHPGMQDVHGGALPEEASFTFTTSPVTGE